jgi:hypothetical protein
VLTKGFLVRNFNVGSPGKGNGSDTPADKTAESRNGVEVTASCEGEETPFAIVNGTGANHANGLSLLVQVGE